MTRVNIRLREFVWGRGAGIYSVPFDCNPAGGRENDHAFSLNPRTRQKNKPLIASTAAKMGRMLGLFHYLKHLDTGTKS